MNVSSRSLGVLAVVLALASGLASVATAAERVVRLDTPPEIAKDFPAYPRIAAPVDAAERKINAALARLDARGRKGAADCMSSTKPGGSSWERSVQVPMRGPRYISYVVTDNFYCGGAHPNISTMSIVYDLATGTPIDWSALLPASFTGKLELSEGVDRTRMIVLSGPALFKSYLEHYRPRAAGSKTDEDADCREAVATAGFDGKPPGMMAWLDAKQAALVVEFDLAHAVQACADEVAIPVSDLRAAGATPRLIEAIEAAHRAR